MSRRRDREREDPPEELDFELELFPEEEDVEYFVDVELESCVRTSVPNSLQSSQS
jgi:hypothetical protein